MKYRKRKRQMLLEWRSRLQCRIDSNRATAVEFHCYISKKTKVQISHKANFQRFFKALWVFLQEMQFMYQQIFMGKRPLFCRTVIRYKTSYTAPQKHESTLLHTRIIQVTLTHHKIFSKKLLQKLLTSLCFFQQFLRPNCSISRGTVRL